MVDKKLVAVGAVAAIATFGFISYKGKTASAALPPPPPPKPGQKPIPKSASGTHVQFTPQATPGGSIVNPTPPLAPTPAVTIATTKAAQQSTPVLAAVQAGKRPTLQIGSTGPDVVLWQQLIGVTTDGKFGPQTKAATVQRQISLGLPGTGIVDDASWAAIQAHTVSNTPTPQKPYTTPTTPPANRVSNYNPKAAKDSVRAHDLAISFRDNVAGQTLAQIASDASNTPAIMAFQDSAGLTADGKVGPKTQAAYQFYISY